MKKALATILALVMAIGLCSVSWADDPVTLKVDPSVSYTTAPARAADATYKTIAEAITAAQAGDTIALVNDLTVDGDSYTEVKKALTIDFGGCTMTVAAGGGFDVYSDLTLKNGTLECLKWAAWVQRGAKLTVAADMVINATSTDANKGGITVQNTGSEVTVYGKVTAAGGAAISGIGNASDGGVTINIEDGAVVTNTNDGGLGIYYPNTSNLNIKGGTITGATGIYVKCGSVSVTGGTIVGNGAKADYAYYGNGGNPTGEALVIDKCNYPGGDPAVSITGGTFSSTNANAVGSYVGNNATGVVTGFITGGTFNGQVRNSGVIENGQFNGAVNNYEGTIKGGTFYGSVKNSGECDLGTPFHIGTISGGTFNGNVTNEEAGRISGGTFNGSVYGTFYTVAFVSNGGTAVPNQKYANTPVTAPAVSRAGYTLVGWYTDEACTAAYDFTQPVMDSVTLYAKWEAAPRYYYNSGTTTDTDNGDEDKKGSPKTFDPGAGIYAVSAALSLTGNTRFPRSVFSWTPSFSKKFIVSALLKRLKAL